MHLRSSSTIQEDLSLQGAALDGTLTCARTHVGGKVDLGGCSVRTAALNFTGLEETGRTARRALPAFRLEGFQFHELVLGNRTSEDAGDYLALLQATETFEVSTWVQIERWLRNQGKDEQANQVYLGMRAERRKPGRMFPVGRPIDRLFDLPIWLAMRYKLLFFLFLLSLIVTTLLFWNPEAVQPKGGRGAPAEEWNLYEAFWTSLQLNLPMVHIPVADKWEVADRPVSVAGWRLGWLHYDYYASMVSLFGYVGVPLFLGGIFNTWLRKKAGGD